MWLKFFAWGLTVSSLTAFVFSTVLLQSKNSASASITVRQNCPAFCIWPKIRGTCGCYIPNSASLGERTGPGSGADQGAGKGSKSDPAEDAGKKNTPAASDSISGSENASGIGDKKGSTQGSYSSSGGETCATLICPYPSRQVNCACVHSSNAPFSTSTAMPDTPSKSGQGRDRRGTAGSEAIVVGGGGGGGGGGKNGGGGGGGGGGGISPSKKTNDGSAGAATGTGFGGGGGGGSGSAGGGGGGGGGGYTISSGRTVVKS